ncbi:hypothetical protein NQ176_g5952 [Zarea fungicola]|uniref:Uncharacterized protein n=1 Tax=Zarea fungicola TaxID=93591 RepID=A0ACC1N5W8_9HYPO|nr:hypothetical protein NQ176_g5952 [Lecanicillium fungicola]
MTIAKLDITTARLLGSSFGITSPYAVVKELLDNAIDAGADSVEITTSQNTLDSIRVRDNGHGINPNDLDKIGRAEHTSKLSAIDELSTGQMQTLGFRGQALSNINSIGIVEIITKTADEPVASKVQLQASIGCVGKALPPVSAPTGTTVQVMDLFHNMPPRRKFLLQASRKNMGKIKELLMAYVLANADLRIIFKVPGNEKLGCKLGQTKNRTMKQAVLELFGSTVVAGGETYRFAETRSPTMSFTLIAFLPIASIDPKAMRGKGAFISVNGRPLCATVGIGQALMAVFKAKIRQSWQRRGLASVPQPLLVLEITCPSTMYDVNVATMKDDLLFADPDVLLHGFEELCCEVYGESTIPKGSDSVTFNESSHYRNSELHHGDNGIHRQKVVSAHIRTVSKVNMLRTNSNATDEGTDNHIVELVRPENVFMCKEKYQADELWSSETPIQKRLCGIEGYFQATESEFDIATDDTATPESLMTNQEVCIRLPDTGECLPRMPLSTVSDSMLNIIASTNAAFSDISVQDDAPRLSDLDSTSSQEQNLISQNAIRIPSWGAAITPSSPSQPSSPLIRGQQPDGQQVMDAPQRPVVSTPPPSDPTREWQGFLPTLRVLRSSVGPQPLSSISSDSSDDLLVTVEHQAAQELRNTQRLLDRNKSREAESEAVLPTTLRLNRWPVTHSGSSRVLESCLSKHQDEHKYDNTIKYIQKLQQLNASWDLPRGNRTGQTKSTYSWASLVEKQKCIQPPFKKHCVDKLGTQQVKMPEFDFSMSVDVENGASLPLEYIPEAKATWSSILTPDVRFCDVRISARLLQSLDTYLQTGELACALSNLSCREVAELEVRIEQICRGA